MRQNPVDQPGSRLRRFHHQLIHSRSQLALVDLRDLSDAFDGVRPAAQHELLKRAHLAVVAFPGCPENPSSQIANSPVDLTPVDGVPLGLVPPVRLQGEPASNFSIGLRSSRWFRAVHQIRVSSLSARAKALSGGLWISHAFRRAGIRFSDSPVPAGYSAVPCGWPTAVTPGSPHRGFRVPHVGDAVGVDASAMPGLGVRIRTKHALFRYAPSNAVSAKISALYYITTRLLEVHDLHPSDLRLARVLPMAGSRLGLSSPLCTI